MSVEDNHTDFSTTCCAHAPPPGVPPARSRPAVAALAGSHQPLALGLVVGDGPPAGGGSEEMATTKTGTTFRRLCGSSPRRKGTAMTRSLAIAYAKDGIRSTVQESVDAVMDSTEAPHVTG